MKKLNGFRMRLITMLAFLVVIAVGYFTVTGIGNACGIGFESITLLCPLGAILSMIAERTAIPMAVISVITVLIICAVLGKVFCSWLCPVPFMQRFARSTGKKKGGKKTPLSEESTPEESSSEPNAIVTIAADEAHDIAEEGKSLKRSACASCKTPCKKSKGIKLDSRHGILAAALGSTLIFGFPVFCLICPVGLTFATVLLVMRLFAFGATTWTIIVFPLIIVVELLLIPKWCKNFCPLGALISLFSGLNKTFKPAVHADKCIRTSQGKDCSLCEQVCPEGINLHDIAAGETTLNDCSKCRACADICPKGAITFPLFAKTKKGTEILEGGEQSCPSSQN